MTFYVKWLRIRVYEKSGFIVYRIHVYEYFMTLHPLFNYSKASFNCIKHSLQRLRLKANFHDFFNFRHRLLGDFAKTFR